jgi:hypothetical protein
MNESMWEFENRVRARALELRAGVSPEFNLAPTMDLVRQAFVMGFDVVPRNDKAPETFNGN